MNNKLLQLYDEIIKNNLIIDSQIELINEIKQHIKGHAAEPKKSSNKFTNCPNCNAPIEGAKCEYCGTHF